MAQALVIRVSGQKEQKGRRIMQTLVIQNNWTLSNFYHLNISVKIMMLDLRAQVKISKKDLEKRLKGQRNIEKQKILKYYIMNSIP